MAFKGMGLQEMRSLGNIMKSSEKGEIRNKRKHIDQCRAKPRTTTTNKASGRNT
jgi:hypothetical protein